MGKRRNSYQKRARWLTELGFSSYGEYLASPLWRRVRLRFLERSNYECEVCGARATQVHHRSYDIGSLKGSTWSLVAICAECHRYGEFDDSGKKLLNTVQVNRRLAERAAEHGRKLISSCRAEGCNNHRKHWKDLCGACEAGRPKKAPRPGAEAKAARRAERTRERKRFRLAAKVEKMRKIVEAAPRDTCARKALHRYEQELAAL